MNQVHNSPTLRDAPSDIAVDVRRCLKHMFHTNTEHGLRIADLMIFLLCFCTGRVFSTSAHVHYVTISTKERKSVTKYSVNPYKKAFYRGLQLIETVL